MSSINRFFVKRVIIIALTTFFVLSVFALDGEVISIVGKAEIQSGSEWIQLSPGDIVKKGAVVSTGFKSEVALKIGNSTFVVQPLSRITIEQLAEQNGNQASQMFLDTGSIKADVKPATNKRVGFTVRSPVATASVRGTGGVMKANGTLISTENIWMIWPTPPDQQTPSVIGSEPSGSTFEPSSENDSDTSSSDSSPNISDNEAGDDSDSSGDNTTPPTDNTSGSDNIPSIVSDRLPEMTGTPSAIRPTPVPQGGSVAVNTNGSIMPPQNHVSKQSLSLGGTTESKSSSQAFSTSSTPTTQPTPPTPVTPPVNSKTNVQVNVTVNW